MRLVIILCGKEKEKRTLTYHRRVYVEVGDGKSASLASLDESKSIEFREVDTIGCHTMNRNTIATRSQNVCLLI